VLEESVQWISVIGTSYIKAVRLDKYFGKLRQIVFMVMLPMRKNGEIYAD
jgi:hypothetical protein